MSPTAVSPTKNSWMLRPLNKASLGYCVPDDVSRPWKASSLKLAPSAAIAASVGLYRGLSRPPAPNGSVGRLAGFAYAPDQVYWIGAPLHRIHARPTHRTPPLCSAKARGSCKSGVASLNQIWIWGWDGSVRGKIAKGDFIQGMQHPRIFGRGHIGQGRTNIAPM